MDINPIFNSRAVYKFNKVHVNEIKSAAFYYQLVSRSKTAIGERAASALERYVCLILLMKMIVLSVCEFHSRQFARLLDEEILSYSSVVMHVALAQSYLTKMSYSL